MQDLLQQPYWIYFKYIVKNIPDTEAKGGEGNIVWKYESFSILHFKTANQAQGE